MDNNYFFWSARVPGAAKFACEARADEGVCMRRAGQPTKVGITVAVDGKRRNGTMDVRTSGAAVEHI